MAERGVIGLVGLVGVDLAPFWPSYRKHRGMQRLAGAGKDAQIFRLQTLHLREGFLEFFLEPVGIATALRRHIHDGFPRGVARTQRVFVRVDDDRSRMKNFAIFRRKGRLSSDTKRHRRGGGRRQLEKRPSRTIGKYLVGFHPALLKRANQFRRKVMPPYFGGKTLRLLHPPCASL